MKKYSPFLYLFFHEKQVKYGKRNVLNIAAFIS